MKSQHVTCRVLDRTCEKLLARAAFAIDLPRLPAHRVECREPAPAPAKRIDADEVSHVKNVTVFQRSVTDNGCLPGHVRPRNHELQRLPTHRLPVLFSERRLRLI